MQRIDAESAVIGCCLADPKAYWQVADILIAEDFSDGAYRAIYDEIVTRARRNDLFDAIAIGEDRPELHDVAMETQMGNSWRLGAIRGYAERVSANALARRIRQAGATIARLEGDSVLSDAQRIIAACSPRNIEAVRHIGYYMRQSLEDMNRRQETTQRITGVVTGIEALDAMTEGWQPSDLVIVAARPSVGKTAFAMQCVIEAAKSFVPLPKEAKKCCLVFSLEMSGKQLNDRVTSAVGVLDGRKLRSPKSMEESDWDRWSRASSEINGLPVYIDESSGIDVDVICARARQQHAQIQLGMVVIDYLTMIKPPKASTTNEALQIVTRTLKGLAKELNVPILLLSQLNRTADGERPSQKSLRDSGAIEQDADVIIFLHRPDKNNREYLELIVEKQRNGPTGDLAIHGEMKYMRFSQAEHRPEGVSAHARTTADQLWDEAGF
jgi:replicative DNA helicase